MNKRKRLSRLRRHTSEPGGDWITRAPSSEHQGTMDADGDVTPSVLAIQEAVAPLPLLDATVQAERFKDTSEIEDTRNIIAENRLSGGTIFRRAAAEGNMEVVKWFLEAKEKFDLTPEEMKNCCNEGAADREGSTPLHISASNGHIRVVNLLVSSGASVNAYNKFWETPLYLASQGGHADIVTLLTGRGAYTEVRSFRTYKLPIEVAASKGYTEIVKSLLDAGSPCHKSLVCACENGHEDTVRLLLQHDVRTERYLCEDIPLHVVAKKGDVRICQILLDFNTPLCGHCSCDLMTPLHHAAKAGHVEVAQLLLAHGAGLEDADGFGRRALHLAASGGHLAIVKLLLKAKTDVNARDNEDNTSLDLAVFEGHIEIALLLISRGASFSKQRLLNLVAEKGRFLAVLCLLSMGTDPKAAYDITPLHSACRGKKLEIARLLIEKKVSVNSRCRSGNTPLHLACVGESNIALIKLLLTHGASINAANIRNETPLHVTESIEATEFLIRNGADPNIPDMLLCTPLHRAKNVHFVQLLMQCSALVDARDKEGNTPLHRACYHGHISIAQELIEHGASINTNNREGHTPLSLAVCNFNSVIVKILLDCEADSTLAFDGGRTVLHAASLDGNVEITRLLLEYNTSVLAKDDAGDTPLHYAVLVNNVEVSLFLLSHNADVNAVNNMGETPLHVAVEMNNEDVAEVLLLNGADAALRNNDGRTPSDIAEEYSRSGLLFLLQKHAKMARSSAIKER